MSIEPMQTIGAALTEATAILEAAGIPEPRREARLIMGLALNLDPGVVLGYPERPIDKDARERFDQLIARRAQHEPFSRLKGRREFWSLDFEVSPDTLDPRPDSETLIEAALALIPDPKAPLRVIDFGTGTGCLLLALLHELPHAIGLGIDILPGAVETARRNARSLGLETRAQFRCGNWAEEITEKADVILSNPPYIGDNDIAFLAPEVARFEPRQALDGGPDGLDGYRALAPAVKRLLLPQGFACLELSAGQALAVSAEMLKLGLRIKAIRRDLSGVERCLVATL